MPVCLNPDLFYTMVLRYFPQRYAFSVTARRGSPSCRHFLKGSQRPKTQGRHVTLPWTLLPRSLLGRIFLEDEKIWRTSVFSFSFFKFVYVSKFNSNLKFYFLNLLTSITICLKVIFLYLSSLILGMFY